MIHHFNPPLVLLALAGPLALAACSDSADRQGVEGSGTDNAGITTPPASPDPTPSPTGNSENAPNVSATPPAGYTDGQGINEGYPDLAPTPLAPEAERTETGARNVLLSFARAIELREYDQAWAMLGDPAKATWSKARFNGLFEGLRDITVAVPSGRMEGAAGSSYYTSQAEITASDADGRPIRIEGPIVLRRVNDVPGSSAEQRRWHIQSVDLSWTH